MTKLTLKYSVISLERRRSMTLLRTECLGSQSVLRAYQAPHLSTHHFETGLMSIIYKFRQLLR